MGNRESTFESGGGGVVDAGNFAAQRLLTIMVPGTDWKKWETMYQSDSQPMKNMAGAFGEPPILFEWSGGNRKKERMAAAAALAAWIRRQVEERPLRAQEAFTLVGFSHGGNVAASAAQRIGGQIVRNLVTIATPVLSGCQPAGVEKHINIFNPSDTLQIWGGEALWIPGHGTIGPAGRTFPGAVNLAVSITEGDACARHGDLLYHDATWAHIREHLKRRSAAGQPE